MRNKSKNGNVKNCPLKNKTPRGQEKNHKKEKIKELEDKNVDFVAYLRGIIVVYREVELPRCCDMEAKFGVKS